MRSKSRIKTSHICIPAFCNSFTHGISHLFKFSPPNHSTSIPLQQKSDMGKRLKMIMLFTARVKEAAKFQQNVAGRLSAECQTSRLISLAISFHFPFRNPCCLRPLVPCLLPFTETQPCVNKMTSTGSLKGWASKLPVWANTSWLLKI